MAAVAGGRLVTPAAIETISTLATAIAIAGVVGNNHRRIWCFPLWWASNTLTAAIHYHAGLWGLLARDLVFLALAVWGWFAWRRKPRGPAERPPSAP